MAYGVEPPNQHADKTNKNQDLYTKLYGQRLWEQTLTNGKGLATLQTAKGSSKGEISSKYIKSTSEHLYAELSFLPYIITGVLVRLGIILLTFIKFRFIYKTIFEMILKLFRIFILISTH